MLDKNTNYSIEYADIYDFITQHKSYTTECESLLKLLKRLGLKKKILSIGCGTGSHEIYLASKGYKVCGIDKSPHMIKKAQEKTSSPSSVNFGYNFYDASKFLGDKFFCIISLFNVINCIEDISSLKYFFSDIFKRMGKGGIFFFESFNGSELLINRPVVVNRNFSTKENYIKRLAKPKLFVAQKLLEVTYKINGFYKGKKVKFNNKHRITLFTPREIIFLLNEVGFSNIKIYSSLPKLKKCFDLDGGGHRMLSFSAIK
jgi:2-polyprenyl-3-methyl-5-hydroxy-6-metoxy-1,4-benzoquinol methylase